MTSWHPEAVAEIKQYAKSRQRGAGKNAGRLFEFARDLPAWRIATLPKLAGTNPEIRWWRFKGMNIYFRVIPPPLMVLKIGRTTTQKERDDCEADARQRSGI